MRLDLIHELRGVLIQSGPMNFTYPAFLIVGCKAVITVFLSFVLVAQSYGQTDGSPFLRFYAPKDIVFEQERLPFTVELSNPTDESLGVVQIAVQFSALVEIVDLDSHCGRRIPNNQTQLVCILPNVEAQSSHKVGFAVVGNVDDRPGFSVGVGATASASSVGGFQVLSQATGTDGIADGSRFVEGETLTIQVARHVLFDQDRDGLGNISEILAGTSPSNGDSFPQDNAVIDITFLYSQQADEFYRGKIGPLAENLITTTNQFLRDNRVNITLRLAAMGLQEYDKPGAGINQVLEDFSAENSEDFPDLEAIRVGTGADILIFLHLFENSGSEEFCSFSTTVGAIHGDFYPEAHAGKLLSVRNVGSECSGQSDLATGLAINMGIVSSREAVPEGGTFPFSAGYVTPERIATRENFINYSPENDFLFLLPNRLSNPQRICELSSCGFDRNDIVNGADTVFSLNATRYLIANLTPSVLPMSTAEIHSGPTVSWDNLPPLNMIISSPDGGAIKGQGVQVNVEFSNDGSESIHNLRIRLRADNSQATFVTEDDQCFVLADNSIVASESDYQVPTQGEVVCFVRELPPDQKAGFSYEVHIDNDVLPNEIVPITLSGIVNMWPIRSSEFCIPFYESVTQSQSSSNPCPSVNQSVNSTNALQITLDSELLDPSLQPALNDNRLTVPYLRLFDGSLVSALFEVLNGNNTRLQLLDYSQLDSSFSAHVESNYSEDGELVLHAVDNDGSNYRINARLKEPSDLFVFEVLSVMEETQ